MESPGGWSDLVTALGLVLVIEGLLLALFPEALKRMVAEILERPTQTLRLGGVVSAALGVVIVCMAALGMGNGAVFQLVPQRFRKEIGVMTGLVGMFGGVGGFYLASTLGVSKQLTHSYQAGFLGFAVLALAAFASLSIVKHKWRVQWLAASAAPARI